MRFSSLLLSSAALLASGTVGFAADLPSKKAAPVEFVRVCSQFGAGFFYVPGSDTCMKVSGRVRADYRYSDGGSGVFSRASNMTSTRTRGYLALDSFTATDWGPVRATTRVFVTRDTGRGGVGGAAIANGAATTDANVTLDWAYIQFAGITAGRLATSTFEFAPSGGVSYIGGGALGRGSDYGSINALAYTASFGGGFSATLALEDGTERRSGNGIRNATPGYLTTGAFTGTAGAYAGHSLPDVVGRLDFAASWGTAMLAGAVHQTRSNDLYTVGGVSSFGDTEYGFAIQGGVKVNLPMLAAGDALYLQAAYASGANSYTGWAGTTSAGTGFDLIAPDVVYDSIGGSHLTKSFSVTGGLLHYWIPTLRQGVYASYGKLDVWGSLRDAAAFTVGSTLIWSPVKGLDIGGELGYTVLTDKPNFYTLAGNVPVAASSNNWFGRIRVQRDF